METIKTHLRFPTAHVQKNIRSERDEMIQRFANHGSIKVRDRKTRELVGATAKEIALILKDVPTADLHAFYRQCEQARSFSRYFWWAIRRN